MKRYSRNIEQKKELIFKAFMELVNEVGYERLTTRNIAKRANISIGTVYHHFSEGKAAIAAGLYERNLSRQMEYLKTDIRTQITEHLKLHKEYKEFYRAFDQAIYAREDIFRDIKRKRDDVVSSILKREKMESLDKIIMGTAVTNLTRMNFPRKIVKCRSCSRSCYLFR